jgi:pimeloyl-ACP methyl ester carboxylesterase
VQNLLINEFSYDPAALVASLKIPALILQGQRDMQVNERDATRLKDANPAAKLVLIPGATHVLKFVGSSDRAANLATYQDPSLPLAPDIIDAVAEFVGGDR